MKILHPFYIIGTVGIIVTAIMHIIFAFALSIASNHSTFFVLYSVFTSFMIVGIAITIKKKEVSCVYNK